MDDPDMTRADTPAVPFSSAEEAWFWAMEVMVARRNGGILAEKAANSTPRPCVPDDLVKMLDRLYRQRRLDLIHARVLRVWGERGTAPHPNGSEREDHRHWTEAMLALDWPLRVKGIVVSKQEDRPHGQ